MVLLVLLVVFDVEFDALLEEEEVAELATATKRRNREKYLKNVRDYFIIVIYILS